LAGNLGIKFSGPGFPRITWLDPQKGPEDFLLMRISDQELGIL
jgi:hypothetical protein